MAFKALTVNTPVEEPAHILAEDDATLYDTIIGSDCVFPVGGQLNASIISNNSIRITDGIVIVGGHVGRIVKGDYEDMAIANGVSGQNRNDLIVARFISGGTGGADTYSLVVVQGTPGDSATDPAIVQGDLYAGDEQRDYPLWRVKIEGLSVVGLEKMYTVGTMLDGKVNADDFLNKIYPVGAIYLSINNVNPGTLFGGTWERFGQGRVLVGVNESDSSFNQPKKTGGEKTHTLTASEMPAHNHAGSTASAGSHNHSASSNNTGAHTHNTQTVNNNFDFIGGGSKTEAGSANLSTGGGNYWIKQLLKAVTSAGAHSHTITVNSGGAHTHGVTIGNAGSGGAHNNLQPYITCYMWVRTA